MAVSNYRQTHYQESILFFKYTRFEMELQMYTALQESTAQLIELERNRSVVMAQHESIALAQQLINQRQANKRDIERQNLFQAELGSKPTPSYSDSFESLSEMTERASPHFTNEFQQNFDLVESSINESIHGEENLQPSNALDIDSVSSDPPSVNLY